ncbi:hypothetical protein K7432_013841 [Basidiobolus ranarum]|uniref:Uncharacterized protein n=1 Tax=Basidiobolus ranarum TaxID=34480 RepID=A0ABR2WIJ4_9FUNG
MPDPTIVLDTGKRACSPASCLSMSEVVTTTNRPSQMILQLDPNTCWDAITVIRNLNRADPFAQDSAPKSRFKLLRPGFLG